MEIKDILRAIQDEPKNLLLAAASLIVVGAGIHTWFNPERVEIRKKLAKQEQIQTYEKAEKAQLQRFIDQSSADAEERYEKGCRLVRASDGRFISINEGMTIIDPVQNTVLPDGTVVCTANGETALIQNGQTASISVLTDLSIVNKAIEEGRAR